MVTNINVMYSYTGLASIYCLSSSFSYGHELYLVSFRTANPSFTKFEAAFREFRARGNMFISILSATVIKLQVLLTLPPRNMNPMCGGSWSNVKCRPGHETPGHS